MRHPLHGILTRWLDTQQFAYDVTAHEHWPSGPWSQPEDTQDRPGQIRQSIETAPRNPG